MPVIDRGGCIVCGRCRDECPSGAIVPEYTAERSWPDGFRIDQERCTGCGICVKVCDDGAIKQEA